MSGWGMHGAAAEARPRRPLRVALVAVVRDAFKGDADGVVRRARAWIETEGGSLGYVSVEGPPAIRDADAAERAAAWAAGSDLDYLLILHATFATGDLLAPLLRAVPLAGVWAVPERDGLPDRRSGVRPDANPLPLNSLCGLTMTLSALDHPAVGGGRAVKWFYGTPGDEGLRRRWSATIGALHGLVALRNANVLQIGGTAPGFYALEERPSLPGVRVEEMPLHELFARMDSLERTAVADRAAAWLRDEPLLEAPHEALTVAARADLALAAIAQEGRYDAIALRCWPEFPERCGAMACAAVGSMADRGIPTACEGDVMGALSMVALQGVADAPSALLDLSDLDVERDGLLVWHCGNAARGLAAAGTRLTTHFNRDGVGIVRDMVLAPGPATGFRLLDGGRRAVVITGAIAEHDSLTAYDGVRGWWHDLRWDGEPRRASAVMSQLLDERMPHHLAIAPGEWGEALHELAVLLGAEVAPTRRVRDALVDAPWRRGDVP